MKTPKDSEFRSVFRVIEATPQSQFGDRSLSPCLDGPPPGDQPMVENCIFSSSCCLTRALVQTARELAELKAERAAEAKEWANLFLTIKGDDQ